MSSAPTFKDLTRAIQAFIPTASLPLPEDLIEILEAYIQKHETKFDDSTADKANEELLSLFNKDVIHTPARYAPFIAIIRRLRPLVVKPDRVFQWFDLLIPVLDHLNQEKGLAAECQGTLLDVMTADDGHDSDNPDNGAAIMLAEHHITIWLEECDIAHRDNDAARIIKEKFFRETLILYGKRRPKEFMTLLDKSLMRKEYRPRFDDTTIHHLLCYFTIIYGLYPINFMDYIRKPQRYLRHAEAPGSDDIEVQPTEMRHASERFRQCHLLHENFYTLTVDSEKTDFGRWIKSEPSEVVADCMALRIDPDASNGFHADVMPGAPEFVTDETDAESGTSALLSRSVTLMRHSSQSSHHSLREPSSTRPSADTIDSPTLRKQIGSSGSQTHLQDMLHSNKVIKSGLSQSLANDSVPSLALSHQEDNFERPSSRLNQSIQIGDSPVAGTENASDDQYTNLYRQILLLQVDLTFERFMKQQHLAHMGELRRRQVQEAASEAETQNLIIVNRHLKQRFEEAKKSELQVKKESERSRTLAKRWEADITTKLRALREDQKKWAVEEKTLRSKLEETQSEVDKLVQLVCDAEVRELGLKQNMQSVEISVSELERLRKEVDGLTESERNLQARETEHRAAMARSAEADSRAEMSELKLKACEAELQQVHDSYRSQIATLNVQLQEVTKTGLGGPNKHEDLVSKLDSALATARTQQQELKKRIATLTTNNTSLQATVMELQTKLPSRSRSDNSHSHPHRSSSSSAAAAALDAAADHSTDSESQGPSGGGVKIPNSSSRRHRARGYSNSDPEPFAAEVVSSSYNATPPLGAQLSTGLSGLSPSGLSGSYTAQRSISPSRAGANTPPPSTAGGASASAGGKGGGSGSSPTAERYYGRGE
ncbi:hypothetical protein SLS62_006496 [Diatrype stigma]|uniref:Tuberous sclerosis 1 n=1 Tax=Diatrype stigma TaxID=117547 RepID=A0AAN9UQW3_9PEZI